jgi:hypothetical protein
MEVAVVLFTPVEAAKGFAVRAYTLIVDACVPLHRAPLAPCTHGHGLQSAQDTESEGNRSDNQNSRTPEECGDVSRCLRGHHLQRDTSITRVRLQQRPAHGHATRRPSRLMEVQLQSSILFLSRPPQKSWNLVYWVQHQVTPTAVGVTFSSKCATRRSCVSPPTAPWLLYTHRMN